MKDLKLSTLITWALLLVLGQLLVTQWTVKAAGNRDVIDYVSFAGTVVGMILAILAIVYSYLANASQKSDSDALRNQVSNLNDAINRASVSSNQFANEVARLEEVRESIALAVSNSAASLEATQEIKSSLLLVKAESEKPLEKQVAGTEPINAATETAVVALLAKLATPRQIVLYYLASIRKTVPDDEYPSLQKEFIGAWYPAENIAIENWFEGQIFAYYWIFYDLDSLKENKYWIQLLTALKKRIDLLSPGSYGKEEEGEIKAMQASVDKVRRAIELVINHQAGESAIESA